MIVTEHYITLESGVNLDRTYSDQGKYIYKLGTSEIYAEAVDISPVRFQYAETDRDIEPDDNNTPLGGQDGRDEAV